MATRRLFADSNFDFENGSALRLNAMAHKNDVPDRDVEGVRALGHRAHCRVRHGNGHAPGSQLPAPGRRNVPNTACRSIPAYGGLLPGVNREHYFGYSNMDEQEIEADVLTAVVEHVSRTRSLCAAWRATRQWINSAGESRARHLVPGQQHQPGHRRRLRPSRRPSTPIARPVRAAPRATPPTPSPSAKLT